jgi:hypothetical protein
MDSRIEAWNARKQRVIPQERSMLLQIALLIFTTAALLIPSVYVRAIMIIVLGALTYLRERALGLMVPVSPGFAFWIGDSLSYVVGGIGTAVLFNVWDDFGIRYLGNALLYLGLGHASYIMGTWLCGNRVHPDMRKRRVTGELTFNSFSICIIFALFVVPVIGMYYLKTAGFGKIYYNLVIGPLQSIQELPIILLAIYLIQSKPKLWVVFLLFGATFAVPFEGIIVGYGRMKLPFAVITLVLIWVSLKKKYEMKISSKEKWLLLITPIILVLLFAVNTKYRELVNLNPWLSTEERFQKIRDSSIDTFSIHYADDIVTGMVGNLVDRLVEKESIELLNLSETGAIERVGWSLRDLKEILLSWVPQTFYPEKGKGYGRDIMEYYGLCAPSNNIPVTVLSDIFRRSGVLGVVLLYGFMGVLSTLIALKLTRHWGTLGMVLGFYFMVRHIALNSGDALGVLNLYIYRLPGSGLVIFALLFFTGILKLNREPCRK